MATLIVSDLHLGRDGPCIDQDLADLLDFYCSDADCLVLAGDTFELRNRDPCAALGAALRRHPTAINALRQWCRAGNDLQLIPGNHDPQLAEDDLQAMLCDLVEAAPTFSHRYRDEHLHVEHGNRYCPLVCKPPRIVNQVHNQQLKKRMACLILLSLTLLATAPPAGAIALVGTATALYRTVTTQLYRTAAQDIAAGDDIRTIVLGHSHCPDYYRPAPMVDYFNSGSWMRSLDPLTPSALTYIHVNGHGNGRGRLLHWKDGPHLIADPRRTSCGC